MSLNITNPDAEADIRKLADEMGVGPADAVATAVREARQRRAAEKAQAQDAWMRDVLAVLAQIRNAPGADPRSWREIEDAIHDDRGLPA